MHRPPSITAATLQAAVHAHYGVSGAATFLPIGNDVASFAYRLTARDGARYFLKLRATRAFRPASLLIPRTLVDHGIPHIVPPLPTRSGALWVALGAFTLSLSPWIDARTAADTGLSDQHWRALGATLQQIHATPLPPALRHHVPHDTFTPSRRQLLTDLVPILAMYDGPDSIQGELCRFWRAQHDNIHAVIERADTLSAQLRRSSRASVLCHADVHTWNVLLDADEQLWIVDWDETIVAPKERDLMFVIGGIAQGVVRAHETTSFLHGYGTAAIDQQALAYYRYAWAVQEMGAYAEEAMLAPQLGEHARRAAVHSFIDLFAPGNIVALARASDRGGG